MSIWEIKIKYLIAAIPFVYSFLDNVAIRLKVIGSLNVAIKSYLPKAYEMKKDKIVAVLEDLGNLPLPEKRQTLLFIPKSNKMYWDLLECKTIPFVAPALTGMAMIDGLPEVKCTSAQYYGYQYYTKRTVEQSPADTTKEALCAKAMAKGFAKIIVIDADANKNISTTKLSCS